MLALAFSALVRQCAPQVGHRTMAAIVSVESGGNTLAIHDNTLGRSFAPPNRATAVAWATQLLAAGHSIDLGLAQINSGNLGWLGLDAASVFDPCRNLAGGATVLADDYHAAEQRFGPGRTALYHAIGAYNTGSLYAGAEYLSQILAAAGAGAPMEFTPVVEGMVTGRGIGSSHTTVAAPGVPVLAEAPAVSHWRRRPAPPVDGAQTGAMPQMIEVGAHERSSSSIVVLDGR